MLNIQVQTTSKCNGRCVMCPYPDSWQAANPGEMSPEVFERILSELEGRDIGKFCMYLENEPLLDPRIFDRLAMVLERIKPDCVEVSTNGLVLTPEKTERLGALLKGVKHEIWVSFHGKDRESYETIMGLPFEKTLANVVNLLKYADETGLRVIIRGAGQPQHADIALPSNFTEDDYKTFWNGVFEKHSIRNRPGVNFFAYHDRAGTITRNGVKIQEPVRPDLTGFRCDRVGGWLHFLYTGELVICCMDYHREEIFGDITRESLDTILSGHSFTSLKAQVEGRQESPSHFICKRCISPGG